MKKNRGYYIDGVIFKSEADIDISIREQAANRYRTLTKVFVNNMNLEATMICGDYARYMHDTCGFSWSEIEAIEIEALEAIA